MTLKPALEIREMHPAELDALLDLYTHMHEKDDPPPPRSELEAVWKEICSNPRLRYIGAYLDGRLIASCNLTVIPNLTRGGRPYGLIENVVTHKDFRRQGHGRAVLERAVQAAWEENCYKVMLLTGRKTEAVSRFYESAGFDSHAKQAFIIKPYHG